MSSEAKNSGFVVEARQACADLLAAVEKFRTRSRALVEAHGRPEGYVEMLEQHTPFTEAAWLYGELELAIEGGRDLRLPNPDRTESSLLAEWITDSLNLLDGDMERVRRAATEMPDGEAALRWLETLSGRLAALKARQAEQATAH